jgi:hypothetical protein
MEHPTITGEPQNFNLFHDGGEYVCFSWFINILSIILDKTECTILLKCNYMVSGRDGKVAERSEVVNSDTEEERLQDRKEILLSKVK